MKEIVFEVAQEADGGYTAEAIGESIFTQADNWDELRANVREAVQAFYFDSPGAPGLDSETWDTSHSVRNFNPRACRSRFPRALARSKQPSRSSSSRAVLP